MVKPLRGVANPEVKKHSGNIIYVDNRPSITRSSNQKGRHKSYFAVLKNYATADEPQRSTYFDDFDPTNDYHKVLFKPRYPVQKAES